MDWRCRRLRGDGTPSTSASPIKNAHSSPSSPRGQRHGEAPVLPPRTRRYCIHSSRGPQRARSLTIYYGDVGLHFALSGTRTTVSITRGGDNGAAFPELGDLSPGECRWGSPAPVPCPCLRGARRRGQQPVVLAWDGRREAGDGWLQVLRAQ